MGERNRKKLKAVATIVLSFMLFVAISLGAVGLANFGFNFPNGNQKSASIFTNYGNAMDATAVSSSNGGSTIYYDDGVSNNYYTDSGLSTQIGSSTTGSTINKVGDVYYSGNIENKVVGSTIVEEGGVYYTNSEKTSRIGLSNPSALPTDSAVNWIDQFNLDTNNTTTLLYDNTTDANGNFYKKADQGSGTEGSPYVISTANEFAFLAAYLQVNTSNSDPRIKDKYFKLGSDIDLAGKDWTPLFNQTRYFTSRSPIHFDGDNHKITNAFVKVTNGHGMTEEDWNKEKFASIFGAVQGSIKNLVVENANVEGERNAAIVANFGSDSYGIELNLENVQVLNSRVQAHGKASGLAHKATDISGCQVSNSEVLIVITDATNYSFVLNNASGQLAYRDYRANGIAFQFNKLEKNGATKTTVSNCLISTKVDLDNYYVTSGNSFDIMALGIGNCTNNTTFDVQNFDVSDCVISNDVVLRTLQSGREFASNGNLNVYLLTGAGAKGVNANSYNAIENINISNCRMVSKADYRANETADTKLIPIFYLRTFSAVEAAFQAESLLQNIHVSNVDIVDQSEFDFVAQQDLNQSTASRQSSVYSNIAGVVLNNRNDNTSDVTSIQAIGLTFKDSTINVNHNLKMPRNTSRRVANNVYIAGIFEKYNETIGYSAIHKGCKVENIAIDTNQEVETWADTADKNVTNQSSQYLSVMMMGYGAWTKDASNVPCSVTNVSLNPTMKYYRDADDKYISGGNAVNEPVGGREIKVMFFGYNSNTDVNIDGGSVSKISVVPNTKLYNKTYSDSERTVATNNHNPITGVSLNIYGVYRTWTSYYKVHSIKNFTISDIYVNADGTVGNDANERDYLQRIFFVGGFTLAHAISYANYENVTVQDIYVNYLANNQIYIAGLAWEENVSNGGETLVKDSTVSNMSVISKFEDTDEFPLSSLSNAIITFGHISWSANPYTINYDNLDVENCLVDIQDYCYAYSRSYRVRGNSHVDAARNFKMTNCDANNLVFKVRVEGQQVTASALFYREQYKVNDNTAENVFDVKNSNTNNILFDIDNTENQVNAGRFNSIYAFTLGYYYGDVFKIDNCVAENTTKNLQSLSGIYSGALRLYNGTNNTSTGNVNSVLKVTNCKNINENVMAETTKRVGTSNTGWTSISGIAFIEYRYAVDYVFDNCVVEDSNYVIENDTNYTRFTGILYDNSQTYTYTIVSEVNDCCFLNSNVSATLKEGCLPGLYARLYGIAFGYIRKVQNCINTSSLYAYCASETYVNGIASANKGIAKMYYGENQVNSDPIVENCAILNCFNYGDLEAKTISGKSYTTGIGTAELIDSCANYGKLSGVYVGGIMWGKADHNAKTFLTIRNCLNAGDIYKVENVNDGYLGGIIGYASNYNGGIQSVLRIENNINLGGIYAGYNADGSPKETLTYSNYMGGIFGWVNLERTYSNPSSNRTSLAKQDWESAKAGITAQTNNDWKTFVTNNQIVNNYTLAVLGGKNNHLSPENTVNFPADTNTGVTGDGVSAFAIRKGTTMGVNRISTPYGTYGINYNNTNVYTGVTTLNFMQTVTRDIFSVSAEKDSNHVIGATFNTATFAKDASLNDYSRNADLKTWTVDADTQNYAPQISNNTLTKRKVVMFEVMEGDGETPRPIVADVNELTGTITVTLPRVELSTVGMTITDWKLGTNNYAVDSTQEFTLNDLMITLQSVIGYDEFILKVDTGDVTVTYFDGQDDTTAFPGEGKTFTIENLGSTQLYLTAETSAEVATYITWQIKNKNGIDWVNIAMDPTNTSSNYIDFMRYVSNDILERCVVTIGSDKIITIRGLYETPTLHTITFVNATFDPENNSENYVGDDKYTLSVKQGVAPILKIEENDGVITKTATVIDGKTVNIATIAKLYHTFVKYEISYYIAAPVSEQEEQELGVGDPEPEPILVTDTIYSDSADLIIDKDITVTIYVAKTEYDMNITLQNMQNIQYDAGLENSLINSFTDKMVVNSALPQLHANIDISGYRFVGWKLKGMNANEFISSENGIINDNDEITEEEFANYLITVSGNQQFNLIAVFQRQHFLNITMDNPIGENFKSEYELIYTDENGVEQHIENNHDGEIFNEAGYNIDENTFVKIKITPNKRVRVLDPEGVEFGGNIAYIFLTDDVNVEFRFEVRPLGLNSTVLNVETPESFDGTNVNALKSALAYYVEGNEGVTQPETININETLVMGHNDIALGALQYRYLDMYLWNIQTEVYDSVDEILVNDEFFSKYVTDDGQVDIMMKVIKQYSVIISGQGLTYTDTSEHVLGSYNVRFKDGENFVEESSNRFTTVAEKESYLVDIGMVVVLQPQAVSPYAYFDSYSGLFAGEAKADNIAEINVLETRSIALRFEKTLFDVVVTKNVEGGTLSATNNIKLGDTITLYYTPAEGQLLDTWSIGGQTVAQWGANIEGERFTSPDRFLTGTVAISVTHDFLEAASLSGNVITINNTIGIVYKRYLVKIAGNNLTYEGVELGNYTISIHNNDEDKTLADSGRYEIDEAGTRYYVDYGMIVRITPNVISRYAEFAGFSGLMEDEGNATFADALVGDNRSIAVSFERKAFTVNATKNIEDGTLSATNSIRLGDTITLYYTPAEGQLLDTWSINGKTVSEWEVSIVGETFTRPVKYITGTVKIKATKGLLDLSSLDAVEDIITINNTIGIDYKQFLVKIAGNSLTYEGVELGNYTVSIHNNDEDKTVADSSRYEIDPEAEGRYYVDYGMIVRITPNVISRYAEFAGFSGLMEDEEKATFADALVGDNRSIAVSFERKVFTVNATKDAEGVLDVTNSIRLGDTITLYYTPAEGQLLDTWSINGKTVSEWEVSIVGETFTRPVKYITGTVKIKATKAFLDESSLDTVEDIITINNTIGIDYKQFLVKITGNNMMFNDFELGRYTVSVCNPNGTEADSGRYEIDELGTRYYVDWGLTVKITPVVETRYAKFSDFSGLMDGEKKTTYADVVVKDNRSIALSFEKTVFEVVATKNVDGNLDVTNNIKLGDIISLYFTPAEGQLLDTWSINGKTVAQWGGSLDGETFSRPVKYLTGTVAISVTPEFLGAATIDNTLDKITINNIIGIDYKQYLVEIAGNNMTSSDNYELGDYTVSICNANGTVADAGRYEEVINKLKYWVDYNLIVKITPNVKTQYAKLSGFSGLMEGENNTTFANVVVKDNRSIALAFEKEVYTLGISADAEAEGELSYTKKFSLGDTVSISYTPANNYVIKDWTLNHEVIDALGATQVGNTITFVATQDVMDKLAAANLLDGNNVNITTEIKTMMSPTLFYGIIGGGGALLILFALVLILVLRSAKIKKQKEETERRLNDMARKFNIADSIKDLKAGGTGGI